MKLDKIAELWIVNDQMEHSLNIYFDGCPAGTSTSTPCHNGDTVVIEESTNDTSLYDHELVPFTGT